MNPKAFTKPRIGRVMRTIVCDKYEASRCHIKTADSEEAWRDSACMLMPGLPAIAPLLHTKQKGGLPAASWATTPQLEKQQTLVKRVKEGHGSFCSAQQRHTGTGCCFSDKRPLGLIAQPSEAIRQGEVQLLSRMYLKQVDHQLCCAFLIWNICAEVPFWFVDSKIERLCCPRQLLAIDNNLQGAVIDHRIMNDLVAIGELSGAQIFQ